jgi:hypothetical protein
LRASDHNPICKAFRHQGINRPERPSRHHGLTDSSPRS